MSMQDRRMPVQIDLFKLLRYILKRIWLVILCFILGFGAMYGYTQYFLPDTYTAWATMYVYNGNPNVVNYQYTSSGDLESAVKLLDTYMVVIKSNKVMDAVSERLGGRYSAGTIASTLSMSSVSKTGVMKIMSTTSDPQVSADICNAVVDIAPAEIIRVVSAGSVEVIDYAQPPKRANDRGARKRGLMGGAAGAAAACALLYLLFLLNRQVMEVTDLTDTFDRSILAMIPFKRKADPKDDHIVNDETSARILEGYAQLRLNLSYALPKGKNVVMISSSVPGEGKSTISANLAIVLARDGKRVLLIDADMRKPRQDRLFRLEQRSRGLSGLLSGRYTIDEVLRRNVRPGLDVVPAGKVSNMPAEMLNSPMMRAFLTEMSRGYDMVLIDTPPINIVSDPLVLSDIVAGVVLVARQKRSNLRELETAIASCEKTGMEIIGLVYHGNGRPGGGYGYGYGYRYGGYYDSYYGEYDRARRSGKRRKRHRPAQASTAENREEGNEDE